jgi:hypothetical protein
MIQNKTAKPPMDEACDRPADGIYAKCSGHGPMCPQSGSMHVNPDAS